MLFIAYCIYCIFCTTFVDYLDDSRLYFPRYILGSPFILDPLNNNFDLLKDVAYK